MTAGIRVQENVALAPLTTLQVGGAARFFVEAKTEQDIFAALSFAEKRGVPIFVLGGGSNLLVSDAGFSGLVLKIGLRGIAFAKDKNEILLTAQAGEDWDSIVSLSVNKNLAGVECLSGIPGSVGATPVQNVGAYGQEVSETISSVRVLDCETKETANLTNAECGFAYRTSIFNSTHKNKFIVLNVTFRLKPNGQPLLRYADLQRFFAEKKVEQPSLSEVRQAVLQIRAAKSMVICDEDENRRSAGSFFKNTIVDLEKFAAIEAKARRLSLIDDKQNIPHFPTASDDRVKIPAAWLIEKSGFCKGYICGRVGISSNHTLAVINRGGATSNEVVEFVRQIQTQVKNIFDVELQPEPIWLGFE
ncbi:MAG: UDP-N-acetylmuramate dehydrogenase [Pyrinomonadaceae bacterium]